MTESVWDYPRPPAVEPCAARVRVELGGVTLADSTRALRVLETSHPPTIYVPPEDVHGLTESRARGTWCEFKGAARYLDAVVGDRRVEAIAWTYPSPTAGYAELRDHVAFYPGRVDAAYLGDERVQAQEGDFYGGWITSDLTGPVQGRRRARSAGEAQRRRSVMRTGATCVPPIVVFAHTFARRFLRASLRPALLRRIRTFACLPAGMLTFARAVGLQLALLPRRRGRDADRPRLQPHDADAAHPRQRAADRQPHRAVVDRERAADQHDRRRGPPVISGAAGPGPAPVGDGVTSAAISTWNPPTPAEVNRSWFGCIAG